MPRQSRTTKNSGKSTKGTDPAAASQKEKSESISQCDLAKTVNDYLARAREERTEAEKTRRQETGVVLTRIADDVAASAEASRVDRSAFRDYLNDSIGGVNAGLSGHVGELLERFADDRADGADEMRKRLEGFLDGVQHWCEGLRDDVREMVGNLASDRASTRGAAAAERLRARAELAEETVSTLRDFCDRRTAEAGSTADAIREEHTQRSAALQEMLAGARQARLASRVETSAHAAPSTPPSTPRAPSSKTRKTGSKASTAGSKAPSRNRRSSSGSGASKEKTPDARNHVERLRDRIDHAQREE